MWKCSQVLMPLFLDRAETILLETVQEVWTQEIKGGCGANEKEKTPKATLPRRLSLRHVEGSRSVRLILSDATITSLFKSLNAKQMRNTICDWCNPDFISHSSGNWRGRFILRNRSHGLGLTSSLVSSGWMVPQHWCGGAEIYPLFPSSCSAPAMYLLVVRIAAIAS